MQALIEFLPLFAFFLAFALADIYVATGTLMLGMAALLLWDRLGRGHIPPLHLASAALVFLLGSATLFLRDERFIIWKPTALFWALALACFWSLLTRRPLIERLMIAASAQAFAAVARSEWMTVTAVWGVFYGVMGLLNLWVAMRFSLETWVHFKVFGLTVLTLLFVFAQTLWLARRGALNEAPRHD